MSRDMTYCVNAECPFKDCERHSCHIDKKWQFVSLAAFDGVCRRYIDYLVEVAHE